ncbi:MAG: class I SAM-dependent methyltransferase [Gammaproteobacteria bacterium]|nr:class I SAM-dependent methyltransferase [Gammaproteobacteria bacterium]
MANDHALESAIKGDHRSDKEKARDQYRHPKETLEFFGFRPDMTVVEISPGGGWYTKILAPALKDKGTYIAAHFDPESDVNYYKRSLAAFSENFVEKKETYGNFKMTVFNPPKKVAVAEPGTADMVLTFRNVHNWYMGGGEEGLNAAFKGFYDALKPGGVLGVVEHRLPKNRDQEENKQSGYMRQDLVVSYAEKAGFKLVGESDVNANPNDTADHPYGVWTLPPSLRLKEKDQEKYLKIGESDRMTLKFVKPAKK